MRKIIIEGRERETLLQEFYGNKPLKKVAQQYSFTHHVVRRFWIEELGLSAYKDRCTRLKSLAVAKRHREDSEYTSLLLEASLRKRADDKPEVYYCSMGYRHVPAPLWWEGRTQSGRVLEHRLVCAKTLGLVNIPDGMVVHHINENKLDNRPENLQMLSRAAHAALHHPSNV